MLRKITTIDPIRITRWLFILNALIWLVFGITSILRMSRANPEHTFTMWVVAILMFSNAAAMLVSGIGITTQRRIFYLFALAVLGVNIVLTFTDQFGLFDFITLVIDIIILALLVASRRSFFR